MITMGQINELSKIEYNRICAIVSGNEYNTELEKMGAIEGVVEHFVSECKRIETKVKE